MNAQLHLANGIVFGRAWSDQDRALLRTVELTREPTRRGWRRSRRNR